MGKLPRMTAQEAEKMLLNAGFAFVRSRGSHRVYRRDGERFILPFHTKGALHPKIVRQLLDVLE